VGLDFASLLAHRGERARAEALRSESQRLAEALGCEATAPPA
jgi:hypothetical protein